MTLFHSEADFHGHGHGHRHAAPMLGAGLLGGGAPGLRRTGPPGRRRLRAVGAIGLRLCFVTREVEEADHGKTGTRGRAWNARPARSPRASSPSRG